MNDAVYRGNWGGVAILNLLQRNIESYMAIKTNQQDYDITVVLNETCVKRVQVKATDLQNKNTNNSISGTEKIYDFLILVVLDKGKPRAFILTKNEAKVERNGAKKFSCSYQHKGVFLIREKVMGDI